MYRRNSRSHRRTQKPRVFGIQGNNSISLRSTDGALLASGSSLGSRQKATEAIADIAAEASRTTQFDVTFTTATTTTRRSAARRPAFQQISKEELAALYYFAKSANGQPGFELYQRDEDQQYYFHFNDTSGQPVLFGRGFPTGAKRNRRLEAVIRNGGNPKRYEVIEENGQYFFILKARNGQEIARSKMFASRPEAEAAIPHLTQSLPTYAEQYIKKRKTRTAGTNMSTTSIRLLSRERRDLSHSATLNSKQHYFHFNDESGKALLFSQGYSSTKARDNGIRSVIRNASIPERFESKERRRQVLLYPARRQSARNCTKPILCHNGRAGSVVNLFTWLNHWICKRLWCLANIHANHNTNRKLYTRRTT